MKEVTTGKFSRDNRKRQDCDTAATDKTPNERGLVQNRRSRYADRRQLVLQNPIPLDFEFRRNDERRVSRELKTSGKEN